MVSSNSSTSKPCKKIKMSTSTPQRKLFIDLTISETRTPSPSPKPSSPSAPNAPSKTPSTRGTSSSSIRDSPKPPSSSPFSPIGYLIPPLSPPPRLSPPNPEQQIASLAINYSPTTAFDFNQASPSISSPTHHDNIPYELLQAHGNACLCCINQQRLSMGLSEEINYMFSFIQFMLSQSPTIIVPPPPPSPK